MLTQVPHEADVLARLDRLERQNRRLKLGGLALLLGLGVVVLAGGQGEGKPKTVEAERFILRDEFGRQRAALTVSKGGDPALYLLDTDEQARVALGLSKDGPGLYFTDPGGKHRAVLARNNDGIGFDLLDENGKSRAAFHVNDKASGFIIKDAGGGLRVELVVEEYPHLRLSDTAGTARAQLRVDKAGGGLRVLDAKGKVVFGK